MQSGVVQGRGDARGAKVEAQENRRAEGDVEGACAAGCKRRGTRARREYGARAEGRMRGGEIEEKTWSRGQGSGRECATLAEAQ